MRAVEGSLKRLGTDYIDLFQLHGFDALTPVEETLSTLDTLVRAGKIRYVGCSNFSGWHLMKSLAVADRYGYPRYFAHQAYYSLVGRDYEWELMPLGLDQKVGAVVWSPLGWARLTGKIRRSQPLPAVSRLQSKFNTDIGPQVADEYLYAVIDVVDEIAKETGKTVPQIALNWLLQRPTVSTLVIGARNEAQLQDNLGAVGWNLTAEQMKRLDAVSAIPPIYPYWHQKTLCRAQSVSDGVKTASESRRTSWSAPAERERRRRFRAGGNDSSWRESSSVSKAVSRFACHRSPRNQRGGDGGEGIAQRWQNGRRETEGMKTSLPFLRSEVVSVSDLNRNGEAKYFCFVSFIFRVNCAERRFIHQLVFIQRHQWRQSRRAIAGCRWRLLWGDSRWRNEWQ